MSISQNVLLLFCLGLVAGCTRTDRNDSDLDEKASVSSGGGETDFDVADLADHPEKYRGTTITLLEVMPEESLRELKQAAGDGEEYEATFQGVVPSIRVQVTIPTSMDVSAVTQTDLVEITFECTEGSLLQGNQLVEIKRH